MKCAMSDMLIICPIAIIVLLAVPLAIVLMAATMPDPDAMYEAGRRDGYAETRRKSSKETRALCKLDEVVLEDTLARNTALQIALEQEMEKGK